jgi:hypothetical protein
MSIGSPGAHVICSTELCRSNHAVGAISFTSPVAIVTSTLGNRELTLAPGQGSRQGRKK